MKSHPRGQGTSTMSLPRTRPLLALAALSVLGACARGQRTAPSTASQPEVASVTLARPMRTDIVRHLDLVGTLDAWQEVMLYARVSGYLSRLDVDSGDHVHAGQVLATIDVPEVDAQVRQLEARGRQAAAEGERAAADAHLQELSLARLEAVQAEAADATTRQEIDVARARLAAAQAAVSATAAGRDVAAADLARLRTQAAWARVTSPFDGRIAARFVDPGALVTAGTDSKSTPILKVFDASRLRVMVDVPETEVSHLEVGRPAVIRVDALPGREFGGQVSRMSGSVDSRTRTMPTEILVDNADGALAPGMFARVRLDLETRYAALAVKPGWLRIEKDKAYVLVAIDGKAKRVQVARGADDGQVVEIAGGLTDDASVIVASPPWVADGTPVISAPVERQP